MEKTADEICFDKMREKVGSLSEIDIKTLRATIKKYKELGWM